MAPSVPIDGTFAPKNKAKPKKSWQEELRDSGNEWGDYLLGPHQAPLIEALDFISQLTPGQTVQDSLDAGGQISHGVTSANPWETGMGLINLLTSAAPGPSEVYSKTLPSMILGLTAFKPGQEEALQKMIGKRDLYEQFDKEGAWVEPSTGTVKTMIGREEFPQSGTPFTQNFYDQVNGKTKLKKGPLEDFLDLPILDSDFGITNQEVRILPFTQGLTNPLMKGFYRGNTTHLIPDNFKNLMPNKSYKSLLADMEGTMFHELTHAAQDARGNLGGTADKYYDKFLKDALSGNMSHKFNDVENQQIQDIIKGMDSSDLINVMGDKFSADIKTNDKNVLDFLAYYMHPMEIEARAAEDMMSRSLEDRAKDYLKGVDSTLDPNPQDYKTTGSLLSALYDLFVVNPNKYPNLVTKKSP